MSAQMPLPRPALRDSAPVRELCERLVPGGEAILLRPQPSRSARPSDCIGNVDAAIRARGGGVDYGWALWETLPGVLLEAEFHAIWRDERGRRKDVTPQQSGARHVIFLPDPSLAYDGRQIDNERVALVDDPLLDEFMTAAREFFEITNRGELATYHGPLPNTPEIREITQRKWRLERDLVKARYDFELLADAFA